MTSETEITPTSEPSSYLRYLPACYANAEPGAPLPFIALYLKLFEKLLSGIADGDVLEKADKTLDPTVAYRAGIRELLDANVIGNLFYPRWSFLFPDSPATVFMPPLSEETPTNKAALFNMLANLFGEQQYKADPNRLSPVEVWARSFFEWLGSTIGLSVDKNWTIDASRALIAKGFAFERARGTPMGMEWLLDTVLSAYVSPVQGVTLASVTVDSRSRPAFVVREKDTEALPAFHVRDSYPDPTKAVVISDDVGPEIDRNGTTFEVKDNNTVAHIPWRFDIEVTLTAKASVSEDDEQKAVLAYYRALRTVLETERPALTAYVVRVVVNGGGHQHSYRMSEPRANGS
jgi:hypothetical protein